MTRFETEPGQQSQIDWGQIRTWFGARAIELHMQVLVGYLASVRDGWEDEEAPIH